MFNSVDFLSLVETSLGRRRSNVCWKATGHAREYVCELSKVRIGEETAEFRGNDETQADFKGTVVVVTHDRSLPASNNSVKNSVGVCESG